MEKLLKQDEIDALFQAARDTTQGARRAPVPKRVAPYNFSAAGEISTSQLRAISSLNELFARNLSHNLTGWLRTRFQVNPVSVEQIGFNEFLLRVPELGYLSSVRLAPLGTLGVLQMDVALVPPIIDLLLGGSGRPGALRELTEIEESIFSSVAEVICAELTAAWEPVGFHFALERRQMQAQAARLLPPNEKTLCVSFEMRLQGCSGLLSLALPAVVSHAAFRSLSLERNGRRHAAESHARIGLLARRIRFGGTLQLPPVRLLASIVESLEPGSVVRLNLPATTSAEWRVGGKRIASGWAVRQGARRAARLECLETEAAAP